MRLRFFTVRQPKLNCANVKLQAYARMYFIDYQIFVEESLQTLADFTPRPRQIRWKGY